VLQALDASTAWLELPELGPDTRIVVSVRHNHTEWISCIRNSVARIRASLSGSLPRRVRRIVSTVFENEVALSHAVEAVRAELLARLPSSQILFINSSLADSSSGTWPRIFKDKMLIFLISCL
jgi:hypothetical protein